MAKSRLRHPTAGLKALAALLTGCSILDEVLKPLVSVFSSELLHRVDHGTCLMGVNEEGLTKPVFGECFE